VVAAAQVALSDRLEITAALVAIVKAVSSREELAGHPRPEFTMAVAAVVPLVPRMVASAVASRKVLVPALEEVALEVAADRMEAPRGSWEVAVEMAMCLSSL
jgi:hypothetical protein